MAVWKKFKTWFEAWAESVEYDPVIDHEQRIAALENRLSHSEPDKESLAAENPPK
jgi:hypothetical protein